MMSMYGLVPGSRAARQFGAVLTEAADEMDRLESA
jgi:hypothetical protein